MFRRSMLLPLLALLVLAGCQSEAPTKLELAQQAYDADNLEEAVTLCNEMIAAGEYKYDALILRGRIYFDNGEYDEAIQEYTAAIELAPDESRAYRFRSESWYALAEYEKGGADRDRSMQLYPDSAITERNLEEINSAWQTDEGIVEVDSSAEERQAEREAAPSEMTTAERRAAEREEQRAERSSEAATTQPRTGTVADSPDPIVPPQQAPLSGAADLTTPLNNNQGSPLATEQPSSGGPQDLLSQEDEESFASGGPLDEEPTTATEEEPGYNWNDYLQGASGTGVATPVPSFGGTPATGLGVETPSTGLLPQTGLSPQTGLTPPTGLGSGVAQPGIPALTPQGGARTGIISDPSRLPSAPAAPITGPIGSGAASGALGAPGAGLGSGLPGVAPPGGQLAPAGTVPTYGPLGQPAGGETGNTGNYRWPPAPAGGTVPQVPAQTPPTTGIQSGP